MPRSSSTRWYAALAALVVFLLLAWLLGEVLTLTNGERTVLRVGLVVLGLVTACLLLWFLRPGQETVVAPSAAGQRDDALVTVDAARRRLPRGTFDAKPVVLVVGTEGSCKTTIVTHSGLDPELLAGEAATGAGAAPEPTAAANVWLVKDAVLAEPGGPVFADAARWQRFVRALRAPRLGAALGRSAPPPRAAVLCVSCDLFYGGAGGQLDTLAQLARQRLADAARELGHGFPVDVVFTKADRLPHFEAWVTPLTRDEVRQPLGAALASDAATGAAAAGGYAERLTPRIERAFAELVASVAGRRVELLGRESVAERRLAAYELPRELGKLAPAATKFLVELCRPTQIGASPQLRGFYFVGARPVVVSDSSAPAAMAAAAAPMPQMTAGATSAFVRPSVGVASAPPSYGPPSTSRRVPQWTFLDRLFPDIVLADPAAPVLAGGGSRVAGLRRGLLGVGIAAALVLSLGVLRSWLGNRDLANRTTAAARAVAALPVVTAPAGTIAFPSSEALRTLDGLRGVLDTLREYQADVPMRLQWGLWKGEALATEARRVWLEGYRKQLHDIAWGALVDSLKALPPQPRPTDDYGTVYNELKAYLITTVQPDSSTSVFLAPVLLGAWQRGQATDADVTALARRQFETYSRELAASNPWPQPADANLVSSTRNFLGAFTGGERIYQNMLVAAAKSAPPVRLAELSPPAPGIVTGTSEMPGSFTVAGWRFMQDAFRNSDKYFSGEKWVLGDVGAALTQNRDSVLNGLRARYRADYVAAWRGYVRSLGVTRSASVADASAKLAVLGSPQSPVLAALAMAARNTNIDSAMAAGFQPVHAVTSPVVLDKFVAETNQPYVLALAGLQGALQQFTVPGQADSASILQRVSAANQTLAMQASAARTAARQIEINFHLDTAAAQVGPSVSRFLEAPIDGAEGVLRQIAGTKMPPPKRVAAAGGGGGGGGGGAAPAPAPAPPPVNSAKAAERAKLLNDRGAVLCGALNPMLQKFPFAADATQEATVAEVAGTLAPGTGKLWAFQQEQLGDIVEKQGDQWAQKADAPVAISASFLAFLNRATKVSNALFAGGAEPRVVFHAKGVPTEKAPEIVLSQGTQVAKFSTNTPPNQFVWPSATGRDVVLSAEGNGRFLRGAKNRRIDRASGDWGIFRLVAHAAKLEGAGPNLKAEWNGGDLGPIAVEFTFTNGYPVLQRNWLGGMTCAEQVTK